MHAVLLERQLHTVAANQCQCSFVVREKKMLTDRHFPTCKAALHRVCSYILEDKEIIRRITLGLVQPLLICCLNEAN